MVTRALLAVVMLATAAHAERRTNVLAGEATCRPRAEKTWNRLGTNLRYGVVPIDGAPMTTMTIGVAIDRPIIGRWRALAEYEYGWIGPLDLEAHNDLGAASLADRTHRVHLGVRRELVEGRWAIGRVRGFLDGEAGGGAMLVDRVTGRSLGVAHAFAGLRGGLSLVWNDRRWDYELVVRGLATPEGPGVLFGIGLVWGE